MKIGFLLNHDQAHQVAHTLPIAVALAAGRPDAEVIVATTNDRLAAEVARLLPAGGGGLRLVRLGLRRATTRLAARLLDSILPAAKLAIYRDNLDFFRSLDALVVAEKTSLVLKTRYGLDDVVMFHTRHGAGDRAIGFDKASTRFDHVLVSGPKIRDRLTAEAGVPPDRMSVVGYPKFDLAPSIRPALPFADPSKPIVLYNPHLSPHLSSWFRDGRRVLDYFLNDGRYNLIFAPHVMLFHRPFVLTIDRLRIDRPGKIARRYGEAPNILIDPGSSASTDMTYTLAADIYLGDVSSQVYEFLRTPRPCLFLNSHGVDWAGDPNYLHWQAGPVIDSAADLKSGLDEAIGRHDRFRPIQRNLFARSFDLTQEPSAERAARAIMGVIEGRQPVVLADARPVPVSAQDVAVA